MKKLKNNRVWLLLLALVLVTGLVTAATAANLAGDVNGDGKVSVFDAQLLLEHNLKLRELTATQQENLSGLTFAELVQLVLNNSSEPDPNAIAKVVNGGAVSYPTTVADMVAAVNASGNTQITLLKDITTDAPVNLPYSCTVDFAEHTITTNQTTGTGIRISAAGSANQVTTLKNGTLNAHTLGVSVIKGGIQLKDMTVRMVAGAAVGFYDTDAAYKSVNRISGCTLISGSWGCVSFDAASTDFSATGVTIEDSTLFAPKADGTFMFVKNTDTTPGTVTFGYDVHMYSYKANLAAGGYTLAYSPASLGLTKVAGTASTTVDGVTYENLYYWSTPAKPVGTGVIAKVTNGSTTTEVTTVEDMMAAVNADGNTTIQLLQDVTYSTVIPVPYTCTIDLNGHTLTTGLTSGNGLSVQAVGTKNQTTTVKNGTLVSYDVALRVGKGAVVVDNMEIRTVSGPCIGMYDPTAAYKDINKITNSVLDSPYACVAYNATSTDFTTTGLYIANTDMISHKLSGTSTSCIFVRNGAATKYANVTFGDNVNMYTYATQPALGALANTFFNGEIITMAKETADYTVGGTTYKGMNRFTTELDPIKILCIGNSFNLDLVQEVYGLAKESGREIYLTNLYYGGCNVARHWKSLTGEYNTVYNGYWITSSLGRNKHATITSIKDAVHSQDDWDIITLQQHFDVRTALTYDSAVESCTPYVENIYNYMREHFPNAKLYWYQTWAYAVGYTAPAGNSALPCSDVATQTNQQEQIIAASQWISDSFNVPQIPCGSAWKIARSHPDMPGDPCELNDNDYAHAGTIEGGQYLNACVWFETLFQESCVGMQYDPSENDNYTLSAEFRALLQQIAHQAVADMHGEDYAK